MTDKELLEKSTSRFRLIAEDTLKITTGNLSHNLTSLRGFALRAAEIIDKHLNEGTLPIVYVVTRCEEHSDYVEKVFFDGVKAEDYCKQFEGDENQYGRDITKVQVTL
jgi:hypothetical protein